MTGYTKLFGSIIASTIWNEDDQTRIIWITMLAMTNQHGEVEASIPGLAKLAKIPVEATEAALEKLSSPDKYSRSKEFEGRRIEAIDGGWVILNYPKYRAKASEEDVREQARIRMQRLRARQERQKSVTQNVTECYAPLRTVTQCDDKQKQKQIANTEEEAKTKKTKSVFPKVPPSLDVPAFIEAWEEWQDYRKEMRKPVTARMAKAQLEHLERWGLVGAIKSLKLSIASGWQGIFEPKPEPKEKPFQL